MYASKYNQRKESPKQMLSVGCGSHLGTCERATHSGSSEPGLLTVGAFSSRPEVRLPHVPLHRARHTSV